MRYDEHPDLGCGWNRRIPGCVRIHRLLLPVPPSSRVRDLNPRGRRRCDSAPPAYTVESEERYEQEAVVPRMSGGAAADPAGRFSCNMRGLKFDIIVRKC